MKIWYQSGLALDHFQSYRKHLTEHLQAAADPDTEFEIHGTRRGGAGIEYRFGELLFTRDILTNGLRAMEQGFDAFTIGSTNDAGLFQAREVLNIPVIGITEASLLVAGMMGRNFSLITPNQKMIPRFEEIVSRYKCKDRLAGIEYMDFKIPELDKVFNEPSLQQKQIKEFTDGARKTIEAGSEVIIPIGGMASLFLAKSGLGQIDGVPVLDTISIAVKVTEMMVKLNRITGTFVSRRLSFASPPEEMLRQVITDYGITDNT
ncbi:aspartate/glutamate racemase family protein [Chloroflexota bacterium]